MLHLAGKRQRRQQTKEEQLYGVFADNSSDEEEFRWGKEGGCLLGGLHLWGLAAGAVTTRRSGVCVCVGGGGG